MAPAVGAVGIDGLGIVDRVLDRVVERIVDRIVGVVVDRIVDRMQIAQIPAIASSAHYSLIRGNVCARWPATRRGGVRGCCTTWPGATGTTWHSSSGCIRLAGGEGVVVLEGVVVGVVGVVVGVVVERVGM